MKAVLRDRLGDLPLQLAALSARLDLRLHNTSLTSLLGSARLQHHRHATEQQRAAALGESEGQQAQRAPPQSLSPAQEAEGEASQAAGNGDHQDGVGRGEDESVDVRGADEEAEVVSICCEEAEEVAGISATEAGAACVAAAVTNNVKGPIHPHLHCAN